MKWAILCVTRAYLPLQILSGVKSEWATLSTQIEINLYTLMWPKYSSSCGRICCYWISFLQEDKKDEKIQKLSSIVRIKNIPHGFYEKQIKSYASQFGTVKNVRVSRNPKVSIILLSFSHWIKTMQMQM